MRFSTGLRYLSFPRNMKITFSGSESGLVLPAATFVVLEPLAGLWFDEGSHIFSFFETGNRAKLVNDG